MDQSQPGIGLKQRQRHYCHWGGWSGVTISDCAFAMCNEWLAREGLRVVRTCGAKG